MPVNRLIVGSCVRIFGVLLVGVKTCAIVARVVAEPADDGVSCCSFKGFFTCVLRKTHKICRPVLHDDVRRRPFESGGLL